MSPHREDTRTAVELLTRADSLLQRAHALAPRWGRLWIDRGWIAYELARLRVGRQRAPAFRRALALADEGLRRGADSTAALELRGAVRVRLVAESQAAPAEARMAETDLRTALDRDSTRIEAWGALSHLLWTEGSTAESELAARQALKMDTYLSAAADTYLDLFYADVVLGSFTQADEWCRRGRLAFPGQWQFVECALTLMRHDAPERADPDSAWKLVRALDALDPPDRARGDEDRYNPIYRRILAATISARAGQPGVARREIARARRAVAHDSTLSMDLNADEAYLRLLLGERQRAKELLRTYMAARPLAPYLARDPLLRPLLAVP
jgi:hypothetical protein